jgi:hypothetical protein
MHQQLLSIEIVDVKQFGRKTLVEKPSERRYKEHVRRTSNNPIGAVCYYYRKLIKQ